MNNPARHLYLIRHCAAAGQEPDAPLTTVGCEQAFALADALAAAGIERILCSPFRRAQDSIRPLAQRLDRPIDIDDRLGERILGGSFDDWRQALRATFDDPNLCYEGGESSDAASARGFAAIEDVLDHGAHATAVVTHGNLLSLLLRRFDPRIGYDEWERLTNPDVYRVTLANGKNMIDRVWHEGARYERPTR